MLLQAVDDLSVELLAKLFSIAVAGFFQLVELRLLRLEGLLARRGEFVFVRVEALREALRLEARIAQQLDVAVAGILLRKESFLRHEVLARLGELRFLRRQALINFSAIYDTRAEFLRVVEARILGPHFVHLSCHGLLTLRLELAFIFEKTPNGFSRFLRVFVVALREQVLCARLVFEEARFLLRHIFCTAGTQA